MKTSRSRRGRRRRPGAAKRRYADLATYLAKSGTTQAKLAAAVGTTQAYISRLAAGRVVPRASLAIKVAAYAHVPIESFTLAYAKRAEAETKQPAA